MIGTNILYSPYFWIVLGVCIAGGWYAKRDLFEGAVTGLLSVVFVGFTWLGVTLALGFPYLVLLAVVPDQVEWMMARFLEMPEWAVFALHPSTILTGILFLLYCHTERNVGSSNGRIGPRREKLLALVKSSRLRRRRLRRGRRRRPSLAKEAAA